jgi:hypothetical protein
MLKNAIQSLMGKDPSLLLIVETNAAKKMVGAALIREVE